MYILEHVSFLGLVYLFQSYNFMGTLQQGNGLRVLLILGTIS